MKLKNKINLVKGKKIKKNENHYIIPSNNNNGLELGFQFFFFNLMFFFRRSEVNLYIHTPAFT